MDPRSACTIGSRVRAKRANLGQYSDATSDRSSTWTYLWVCVRWWTAGGAAVLHYLRIPYVVGYHPGQDLRQRPDLLPESNVATVPRLFFRRTSNGRHLPDKPNDN